LTVTKGILQRVCLSVNNSTVVLNEACSLPNTFRIPTHLPSPKNRKGQNTHNLILTIDPPSNSKTISPSPAQILYISSTQKRKMSAPNPGRQSPSPSRQSKSQGVEPPATDVNNQGQQVAGEKTVEASKEQLGKLESNPKGPLEEAAKEKTAKGGM